MNIVLLSGGLDSTLALFGELASHEEPIVALNFTYGQIHEREVRAAQEVCEIAGDRVQLVEHTIGPILDVTDVPGAVVPARNLLFLSLAASYAGGEPVRVVMGACSEDHLGFPDCRSEFFRAAEAAFAVAALPFRVVTPFLHLSKAEAIMETREAAGRAWGFGGLDKLRRALEVSWSCYDPQEVQGEERPCGVCMACGYRARAFEGASMEDPYVGDG